MKFYGINNQNHISKTNDNKTRTERSNTLNEKGEEYKKKYSSYTSLDDYFDNDNSDLRSINQHWIDLMKGFYELKGYYFFYYFYFILKINRNIPWGIYICERISTATQF
jgi:hypothetical protein